MSLIMTNVQFTFYCHVFRVCITGNARSYPLEQILPRVFSILENIQETLKLQSRLMQSMLRKNHQPQEEVALPEGPIFPIQNLEAFDELETKLADPAFQNALVCLHTHMTMYPD